MSTRALSPGTVVHRRYRVERVLGEGGFGVTYMVYDMRENRIAAMKEYFPLEIADRRPGSMVVVPRQDKQELYKRFKDSFLQEAQTIYNYSGHANIISVYHLFDNENGTAYYVMEYIDGVDLGKFLTQRGQRVDWETLKPIVAQIVSALIKVHASGVIHCDISPDNIFILGNGQAKLIDFGAAKNVVKDKSTIMLLKRGFAPPEQMMANGKLGPWTDIYALAVTVYRAITGTMPPAAEDRQKNDETCWPSEMGIPIPGAYWERALRRGMALRVEDRFQNARDFWMELSGGYTTPREDTRLNTQYDNQPYPGNNTQGYILNQPYYPQNNYQNQPNYYPQNNYQNQHPQNNYQNQPNYYPQNGYQNQPNYYPQNNYQNRYPQNNYQNRQNPYPNHNAKQYPSKQNSRFMPMLECIQGYFKGKRFPLTNQMIMGSEPGSCSVLFPGNVRGISRKHLQLWVENGQVVAMDMGSSYGTWINNKRIAPGKPYILPYGSVFFIGEKQYFRVLPPSGEETHQLHR